MRYLLIAILVHLFCAQKSTAQNGCIDSVTVNQFFPSNFEIDPNVSASSFSNYFHPQRDNLDNVYLDGTTNTGGFNNTYWSIVKFNNNNQLVWYKNYRTDIFKSFKHGGYVCDVDANDNLLFYKTTSVPNPFVGTLSKMDNAGNLLWSKILKHGTDATNPGVMSRPFVNNNGEIFTAISFTNDLLNSSVAAFSSTGNLLWTKKYGHPLVPKYHTLNYIVALQDNNTLVMAIYYYYNADSPSNPNAKFGIQFVKLDAQNGSILQYKSFMFYNDIAYTSIRSSYLYKLSYNNISRQFLIVTDENAGGRNPAFSLFDENFNHIKTNKYTGDAKTYVGKGNELTMVGDYQGPFLQWFNYALVNSNLDISSQKIVSLTGNGFPLRNFGVALSFKKNGILNFNLGTYSGILSDYIFMFDHSPAYNNISSCLGKDTIIYKPTNIYVRQEPNVAIEETGSIPITITDNIPDYPVADFTLPKTELCKQISICDTIKLLGTQYHCLSSPLDSFKIIRNPLCKRVTNWQVDTANIKILNQNDTALYVQYKQPYRGKIKVSFGGCSLTDSIAIEVYAAKTGVNLGNDTMHCPGKTITLKAGKNFKTYLWQDGSSKDSLVAAQPGSYHITATDSCGNIFKDTLLINPFDVVLKADYAKPICPADTATIILPNQLYNYNWLPTTTSSLNNFTWKLFPATTTVYSITGERLPGCTISDTVLINVKLNCLPVYIYFPTAFTPDNSGFNDTYKPAINGQLALYEFIIYNRYGQPVFKTSNPTQGWDGKFKNSPKPLSGGYVWSCKYQFAGRMLQQEQGTFVLIR